MKWQDVTFETLYAAPSRNGIYKTKEFHGNGCRIVNMGELFGFDFISNQEMKRLEMSDSELVTSALEDGDLLFGRRSLVEAGAGKCSLVIEHTDPLTFESSIIRVRLNKKAVNPRFLYYYFRSPQGRGRIRSIVSGVTVKGIRGSELKRLPVLHPPKEIQNGIADVLTAYDDLIENNRRRMELLEESARLLYREWFVRLRFPGYEHAKIKNGIPEGWRKETAFDAMQVMSGGTPKTTNPDFWDGEIPFYTPKDSVDASYVLDTEKHVTELGLSQCNSKLYPKDTIFITARGTVGNLNLAQRPMAMNQSCYALAGRGIPQKFLFCTLREAIQHFQQHASGAVFDAIIVDTFKIIPFVIPDAKLIRLFEETIEPVFQQIENLLLQNQKLRAARDLLLPRLMSGEIAA